MNNLLSTMCDAYRVELFTAILATEFDIDHQRGHALTVAGKPDRFSTIPAIHAKYMEHWMEEAALRDPL